MKKIILNLALVKNMSPILEQSHSIESGHGHKKHIGPVKLKIKCRHSTSSLCLRGYEKIKILPSGNRKICVFKLIKDFT